MATGFMYNVKYRGDGTVEKIPRAPGNTSVDNEKRSLEIHRNYLGELLVPDTEIVTSSSNGFETHQQKVKGSPVNIINTTNDKVIKLLESGQGMQNKEGILFDIFGLQGMISLFNYYFAGTAIKKLSDLLLPANARYLKLMHNLPEGVLKDMNTKASCSPFIAHNILETPDGEIQFIDTDYRPLDTKHPLNLLGNWITQKALDDIKNRKS